MSGEDDTFDIDIYGDEGQDNQQVKTEDLDPEDRIDFGEDDYGYDGANDQQGNAQQGNATNGSNGAQAQNEQRNASSGPSQGVKRKAEDYGDEEYRDRKSSITPSHASDPQATAALKVHELHWWTTEEDLRAYCVTASVEDQLRDIMFGEHKINGKSRGEAYLEFTSPAAAEAVKKALEVRSAPNAEKGETEGKRLNPFHVYFSPIGNPFKGRDSGAQGKKEYTPSHGGRGGAYNNFNNRGGGFRGRGDFNNRGGGGFNRGGFQGGMNQGGGNWNAGGMGGMGPGFNNPMMGMANMPMMGGMPGMGNFGNMGRGGMMNRGGFGPNMGGMGMMGGGGGGGRGNMMGGGGRGNWSGGGGFQQGGGGGYGGGGW